MDKTARTPSTRNYRRSSSERTSGRHRMTGLSQRADVRPSADDRRLKTSLRQLQTSQRADARPHTGRPAILTEVRGFRTSGVPTTEHFQRTSDASGRPVPLEPPDVRCPADVRSLAVSSCGLRPMYPFTSPLFCTKTIYRPLPPPR